MHIILTCIWKATAQKGQIFGFPWVPFKYRFECTCIPKRVDDSWVTMCLLLNTKWLNFQLYHGKNKLHSMRWWWCPPCTRLTSLVGLLWCLLAPQVDTTLHSDTFFKVRANQSLLLLLNAKEHRLSIFDLYHNTMINVYW